MHYENWVFNPSDLILPAFQMRSTQSAMQQAAPYLVLGVQLAGTVVVCGAVGWWIDSVMLLTPVGLLIGVVGGSIVGLVQFLRTVQRLSRRDRDLANSEQER